MKIKELFEDTRIKEIADENNSQLKPWKVSKSHREEIDFTAFRQHADRKDVGAYVSVITESRLLATKRDGEGTVVRDREAERSQKVSVSIGTYTNALTGIDSAKFKPLQTKVFGDKEKAWHFVFETLGLGFEGFFRGE